jgi:tetratricopeptide (TPR) repeat protein
MTHSESSPCPPSLDQLNQQVAVSREPFPLAELRCFPLLGRFGTWGCRLLEGGRELWLYAIEDGWLFLWIVDVDEGRGRCRVSVPLGTTTYLYEVALRHDTLWLSAGDEEIEVIEISVTEWKIRSRRPLRPLLPERAHVVSSWIAPGGRYLWLETHPPIGHYVVDLQDWSLRRFLPDPLDFPLSVVGGPRVLQGFADVKHGDYLFTPDGSPVPGTRLPIDYMTRSLAPAPDGEGLLSVEVVSDDDSLYDRSYLTLHRLVHKKASGRFKSVSRLRRRVNEENPHGGIFRLAVSSEEDTCFVLIHVYDSESRIHTQLLAVALSESRLWVRYRVEVPHDTVLAQDPEARRVVAICTEPDALHVIPLERGRPAALEGLPHQVYGHRALLIPIVELDDCATCGEPVDENDDSLARPLSRELKAMDHSDRMRVIGHYRVGAHDDAEGLVTLYYALSRANVFLTNEQNRDLEREREAILDVLREEHAEHPSAALTLADYEAHAERFQEADRWLQVAAQGDLDRRRQHYHHLKALVHFHAGRIEEAYAELLRATESGRRYGCSLSGLFRLCKPTAADSSDEAGSSSMIRPLLAAIRTTNRAFAAGDFASAFAALDNSLYWQELEVETSARRAAAVLRMPVRSDGERIRTRFVLARFREALHGLGSRRVRLPGVTWDDERIERIEEAARAWLENEAGWSTIPL